MPGEEQQRDGMNVGQRYGGQLRFCYVVSDSEAPVERCVEDRIVVVTAPDARSALALLRNFGKQAEHDYTNDEDAQVDFVFVGLVELLRLDDVCSPEEMWYEIMHVKATVGSLIDALPKDHALAAIREE